MKSIVKGNIWNSSVYKTFLIYRWHFLHILYNTNTLFLHIVCVKNFIRCYKLLESNFQGLTLGKESSMPNVTLISKLYMMQTFTPFYRIPLSTSRKICNGCLQPHNRRANAIRINITSNVYILWKTPKVSCGKLVDVCMIAYVISSYIYHVHVC